MRASVQGNDPHIVDHLGHNRDMIVSLNDLIVIVVERRQHRRSAGNPGDTPLAGSHVFRAIAIMTAVVLSVGFKFPLGFRRERRNCSVLGVRDDGSTLVWQDLLVCLQKCRVIVSTLPASIVIRYLLRDRGGIRPYGTLSGSAILLIPLLPCFISIPFRRFKGFDLGVC